MKTQFINKVILINLFASYCLGDEILAINGKILQGMSHDEAINEFRAIKNGQVILRIVRRDAVQDLKR